MFKENEKLFEKLLMNSKITTKELKELGYYAKKINDLIDLGIIKREKRGQYSVIEEVLLKYKEYLGKNIKDYEKLAKEFLETLEIDSEEDILRVFRSLQENATAEEERRDANFYLILLNNIYKLNNEELERLKTFKFRDYTILASDGRFLSRNAENKMRIDVFGNKIYKAMNRFNPSNNKDEISKQIENSLLNKVLLSVDKVRDYEDELVDKEQYDELLELLTLRMKKRIMSPPEYALFLIIRKYNNMVEKGQALSLKECDSNNYLEQIVCNNFLKAYNLFLERFGESTNIERGGFIEKALRRTIELVSELRKDEETTDIESFQDSTEELAEDNDSDYYENPLDKIIEDKIDELYDGKSIIVLDPMSNEERKYIHELISTYYDVVSFSIGDGCERRVVLRFKPASDAKAKGRIKQENRGNYCCYSEILAALKAKMREKDYAGALIECRKLIETGTPWDETFITMGRCLLKLGKRQEAIDCFRVVTYLSREHGKNYDYTYFIDSLCGIDLDDKKPNFEMDLEEFTNRNKTDFDNLDALVTLIVEEGKSLEEAIVSMGLDADSADIARLIYARDCYYLERYNEGDTYLSKVERRKKKSAYVMKLANEIRTGKRFYKNRLDSDKKCLVLKRG